MRKIFIVIVLALLFNNGYSQADTLIRKLDSLSQKKDSTGIQVNNTTEAAYNKQTQITSKTYFILLGSTLKQEFTKPFHMTSKEWGRFGLFTAATGALMFADEPLQKEALKFRDKNGWTLKASKYVTNAGGIYEIGTLGALAAYGYIFKNKKVQTTTLLASQAYISGSIIEFVVKNIFGRTRPSSYGTDAEAEPKFRGPFQRNSSFPSGHATVAFSAAAVYAMEYKSTIWVPIVAYTAAGLISASRITENKHWTTDVLVGSLVGFLNGRHVVNNYHRYQKIKSTPVQPGERRPTPKKSISYNLQYNQGHLQPGLIYHIR
ncbi:MAG TPA: phosphatase PAP2 family protein [Ferruginibacter sp.]|nr:phosphatase PAP2 family protein [Ferruginibacter sp.]